MNLPRRLRPLAAAVLLAATGFVDAASAASSTAAAAATLTPRPIAFTERTLANGLQVITVPTSTSPTVSVQVWYHVGSRDDPAGRSGFAHLFEHMMFKGTRYLKAEQFDRLTEDVGGANNASTGNDVTEFHATVPSNHLEPLLWAEAERMSNLNVDAASFNSERAVVEEEYRQRVLASPYGRLFNIGIAPAAFAVHPYQRPTIGSIADLDAASLADVDAFHRTFYRPDNATLVVAGDFDAKVLDAGIDKYFGGIEKPAAPIPRVTTAEPVWSADRSVALTGPNVPLPAVALVWQAPAATSVDAPALRIAAALLADGESSRLNQALVYRQQIAMQAGLDADLRDGPSLLIGYAVAAGGKSLAEIRAAYLAQVRTLATTPIGAPELAKIKTQVLTSALLTRETPGGLATAVAEAAVVEHDATRANSDPAALQAVSAADVQQAVQRWMLTKPVLTLTYQQAAAVPPSSAASSSSTSEGTVK